MRVRSETLEVYRATAYLLSMPRLLGTGRHSIDYRHVIWSLVRKPGAFAHYRYRDDLFPSLTFRRAYDALEGHAPERADRHYVRLLHLAASTCESEIETALGLLLEQHVVPTFDVVRDLTRSTGRSARPAAEPTAAGPERVRPSAQPGGSPCLTAKPRCGSCCGR